MLTKVHVALAMIPICIGAAVYGGVQKTRADDRKSELHDVDEQLFNAIGGAQVNSTLYATWKQERDALRAEAGDVAKREERVLLARRTRSNPT
ncbi:MAG: hypothetical protein O2816_10000 [Planctomycetota bacterium]|nr:hypothetical protein [Planctomycetota bacterium]